MSDWFTTTWAGAGATAVAVIYVYAAVILGTRMAGLRSFSKMSSFDFAMTVAIGTLVASTALARDPPVIEALIALALLYLLQFVVARLRVRFERFAGWIDNTPVVLIENGRIIDHNLRRVRITHEELRSAIRAAQLPGVSKVAVAVMETTGDISVVPGPEPVDPDLLRGVRRGDAGDADGP